MDTKLLKAYRYGPVFDTGSDTADADATTDDATDTADAPETEDPAELKKELAKTKRALQRANAESAKRRADAKVTTDEQKAAADRVTSLETELRTRDAIEALREAGAQGDRSAVRRLVKLLDSIEPDALDDAVAGLKEDHPKLFEEPKPKGTKLPRTGNPATDDKDKQAPKGISSTSQKMLRMR